MYVNSTNVVVRSMIEKRSISLSALIDIDVCLQCNFMFYNYHFIVSSFPLLFYLFDIPYLVRLHSFSLVIIKMMSNTLFCLHILCRVQTITCSIPCLL